MKTLKVFETFRVFNLPGNIHIQSTKFDGLNALLGILDSRQSGVSLPLAFNPSYGCAKEEMKTLKVFETFRVFNLPGNIHIQSTKFDGLNALLGILDSRQSGGSSSLVFNPSCGCAKEEMKTLKVFETFRVFNLPGNIHIQSTKFDGLNALLGILDSR